MNDDMDFANGEQVLYVEDHPVNILLMAALFEHRPGLSLTVATSGAEAMHRAVNLRPAILMLDLGLPDCHGSALLLSLRQLPGYGDIPAVAVTAEDDFRIQGTGFCELWSKPLDLRHVLARLDQLVPSRHLHIGGSVDVPLRQPPVSWQSSRA